MDATNNNANDNKRTFIIEVVVVVLILVDTPLAAAGVRAHVILRCVCFGFLPVC
jgi:hypothetical protein